MTAAISCSSGAERSFRRPLIGAYSYNNPYDVLIMLCFGMLGYFMRLFKIPEAPLVVTFLLAPQAEENLRRGLLINEGAGRAAHGVEGLDRSPGYAPRPSPGGPDSA